MNNLSSFPKQMLPHPGWPHLQSRCSSISLSISWQPGLFPKELSDHVPPCCFRSLISLSLAPASLQGHFQPPASPIPHTGLSEYPAALQWDSKSVSACAVHSTQLLVDSHILALLLPLLRGKVSLDVSPSLTFSLPIDLYALSVTLSPPRSYCGTVPACRSCLLPLPVSSLETGPRLAFILVFGGFWPRSCPGEVFGKWHCYHMSCTWVRRL